MAVRRETLRLGGALRITITGTATAAVQDLTLAWARAWKVAVTEWEAAAAALVAAAADGRTPGAGVIARDHHAQRALAVTRALLGELSQQAGVTVLQACGTALDAALTHRPTIVGSQLPADARADLVAGFGRVDHEQLTAMVERITERVTSTLRPLSAEATDSMLNTLIRGVMVGDNPRVAARAMVDNVHGQFDGGLTRANVIARTEILDAHRKGGAAWDRKNTDVLAGWQWIAQLDKRTCPSCWSKHGTTYGVDDDGPWDHQQGRCARMPITRPWADLGIDLPEPPGIVPDAERVFKGLPETAQLQIMGAQRLDLLRSGKVSWGDLSARRRTPGWRDSFAPTPVRTLTAAVV